MITGRIYGLETEYGVFAQPKDYNAPGIIPNPGECVKELFEYMPSSSKTTNYFLSNGARLYIDIGEHPEYASAECDQVYDVVANDRAGEEFLRAMLSSANKNFAEKNIEAVVHLFKNNVDSVGNTFGCHENYLFSRKVDFDKSIRSLVNFFATRQILTGAGHIKHDEKTGESRYVFSPRADFLSEQTSADTTRSRPIINTKDEPHGDVDLYRRLHVLCSDSNICDVTTMLKIALTGIVLDYLESGKDLCQFDLVNPIEALHQISDDFTGTVKVDLVDGRKMSAVEIQTEIIALLEEHLRGKNYDLDNQDDVYIQALSLAKDGLEAIVSRDFSKVDTKLDWAIKYKLFKHYMNKHNIDLSSPLIARLNLAYHDLDPKYGLAPAMRAKGMMQEYVAHEDVIKAMTMPPQTSRAKVRGDFVEKALRLGFDITVNWSGVRLNNPYRPTIDLMDPFANYNEEVAQLMQDLDVIVPEKSTA